MNENLLQYVWKYRLFDNQNLKTTKGETISILNTGEHNTDSGPDFFNARIKCGNTVLAGNIEVHTRSGDWKKHFHQEDKTYQNIILHVVYQDDEPLQSLLGENVLTLELKHRIPKRILERYEDLQQLQPFIPCRRHWNKVDEFIKDAWIHRMLVERLEMKCEGIEKLLSETNNNWEDAFYISLARNFGFKINAVPFELIARGIPHKIFSKNKADYFQIESLLFGVGGFLNDSRIKDKYYLDLKKEFNYQKQKHNLQEIDVTLWKFLRLRPANFPQVRLAQFANLIYRSVHLFSKITEQENPDQIKPLFDCIAGLYWDTHYTFSDTSTKRKKRLGEEAENNIMINTVAPFLFLYGKSKMQFALRDLAIHLLENLPPENNTIVRKWEALPVMVKNAARSQGLLQLKKQYCDRKRCLHCSVGLKILKDT